MVSTKPLQTKELARKIVAALIDEEVDELQRLVLDVHDKGLRDEDRRTQVRLLLSDLIAAALTAVAT